MTVVFKTRHLGYYDVMGFGENLHNELVFQDIQIKELAARTGIKKSTLDKYLSGNKSQPSVENAVKNRRNARSHGGISCKRRGNLRGKFKARFERRVQNVGGTI